MDKVVHFKIPVDDVARAREFYASAFEWELNKADSRPFPLGALGNGLRRMYVPSNRCEIDNRSAWTELVARLFLTPCHLGNEHLETLKAIDVQNKEWFPFVSGARFGANPSARTLAGELKWLAKTGNPAMRRG